MHNTEMLAKERSFGSSVYLSCRHLLPNVTDIWEKADKITSVPFQDSQVQGGRALGAWYGISIPYQVSSFLDICNSPSIHWLVHVGSLHVFEI